MAQPTITFSLNTGTEGTPTWTPVLVTVDTIYFTGSGSSNGNMKPITQPSGSNKTHVADELWFEDGDSTDLEVTVYEGGADEAADYTTDIFPTDLVNTNYLAIAASTAEAQAGELEAWDDNTYVATTKELLNGTTELSGHSQLRAAETSSNVISSAGAGTLPGAYETQTAQTTTYQLQGSTRSITFSSAIGTADYQNRVIIHVFTCADSAAGTNTVDLTYLYYYT
jgi:hypothetical protein